MTAHRRDRMICSIGAFLLSVLTCSPFAGRIAAWAPVAGLRENAAPRLALEVAMLAWPTTDVVDVASR